VATSWYSYDASGFTYLLKLNSRFAGPLTTVRGSSGSAHHRAIGTSGGPSAVYRWQGALVFIQVVDDSVNCDFYLLDIFDFDA